MDVGKRIRQRRVEIGMTVDELANKIGKNRATIYRYENGDIENLPLPVLEPIAKALGIEPSDLLSTTETMSTEEQHKSSEIVIDVKADTSELDRVIEKLKEANSLADELASKISKQSFSVEVDTEKITNSVLQSIHAGNERKGKTTYLSPE